MSGRQVEALIWCAAIVYVVTIVTLVLGQSL
jgi:hypothetical protein